MSATRHLNHSQRFQIMSVICLNVVNLIENDEKHVKKFVSVQTKFTSSSGKTSGNAKLKTTRKNLSWKTKINSGTNGQNFDSSIPFSRPFFWMIVILSSVKQFMLRLTTFRLISILYFLFLIEFGRNTKLLNDTIFLNRRTKRVTGIRFEKPTKIRTTFT